MLAAVRWAAVILGLGAGALTATVTALASWLVLTAFGVEEAPLVGLTLAVLLGFTIGGLFAGRLAIHSHRFHGSLSGLGLATLVVVIARLGGSPAPTSQVLLLALLGIVLGGLGGTLGKRVTAA